MTGPMHVLAISGSLRRRSTNLLLIETAALLASRELADVLRIEAFAQLGSIPLFNPDEEEPSPPAVAALRRAIHASDAILISSPEYAHSLPGALKNALDWLVGCTELSGKPVALLNASARSLYAQAALREVLTTMNARFLDAACVTVPLTDAMRTPEQLAADASVAQPLLAGLRRLATITASSAPAPLSQPVGAALPGWQPRPRPEPRSFAGRYCRVVPLDPAAHADALYTALGSERDGSGWTYLLTHPSADARAWRAELKQRAATQDPLFFTVFNEAGEPAGLAAYLRIVPEHGVIEVGHIQLAPRLQRSRAATEAQYLLLRHAFDDLGYRRYEWKCDALNAPSRRAALRLGFQYEGVFRNAIVYKGRSRDTAWFSITDEEWPKVKAGFERWLAPENFDDQGGQLRSLANLRETDS